MSDFEKFFQIKFDGADETNAALHAMHTHTRAITTELGLLGVRLPEISHLLHLAFNPQMLGIAAASLAVGEFVKEMKEANAAMLEFDRTLKEPGMKSGPGALKGIRELTNEIAIKTEEMAMARQAAYERELTILKVYEEELKVLNAQFATTKAIQDLQNLSALDRIARKKERGELTPEQAALMEFQEKQREAAQTRKTQLDEKETEAKKRNKAVDDSETANVIAISNYLNAAKDASIAADAAAKAKESRVIAEENTSPEGRSAKKLESLRAQLKTASEGNWHQEDLTDVTSEELGERTKSGLLKGIGDKDPEMKRIKRILSMRTDIAQQQGAVDDALKNLPGLRLAEDKTAREASRARTEEGEAKSKEEQTATDLRNLQKEAREAAAALVEFKKQLDVQAQTTTHNNLKALAKDSPLAQLIEDVSMQGPKPTTGPQRKDRATLFEQFKYYGMDPAGAMGAVTSGNQDAVSNIIQQSLGRRNILAGLSSYRDDLGGGRALTPDRQAQDRQLENILTHMGVSLDHLRNIAKSAYDWQRVLQEVERAMALDAQKTAGVRDKANNLPQ
jgi:hypothetical protein